MSTYSGDCLDVPSLDACDIDIGPFCSLNAEKYDLEAAYMDVRYSDAHKVQNNIVKKHMHSSAERKPIVLDVGCGTGTEGMEILFKTDSIRYVGIDRSPYMLEEAKIKHKDYIAMGLSHFIEFDFQELTHDKLEEFFQSVNIEGKVECVISALAFHHYGHDIRCELYNHMHEILSEGGLFILTDLFTNSIDVCGAFALGEELRDINKSTSKLVRDGHHFHKDTTLSANHYVNDNILNPLLAELELLASAGFNSIDVVYRNVQLAVIVSSKECL